MGRRGKLSATWGLYTGSNKPTHLLGKRRVRYEGVSSFVDHDLMCDYIDGAEWWIARSEKSVNGIIRAFDRGDVGCCLYERTGAIIPLGKRDGKHLIALQLVMTGFDWDIDLCLEEIGVYVDEMWDGEDVDTDD